MNSHGVALSTAGMVLGIVSIVLVLLGGVFLTSWLCLPMAVIGLILSIFGISACSSGKDGYGMAVAGIILNTLVLAGALLGFASCGTMVWFAHCM